VFAKEFEIIKLKNPFSASELYANENKNKNK
jgi:hypothetical protein